MKKYNLLFIARMPWQICDVQKYFLAQLLSLSFRKKTITQKRRGFIQMKKFAFITF